jgi:hypothetical protein
MSGVIDEDGQWEHCNVCTEFVLIQELLYEQPSERFPFGRDICEPCSALPAAEQDELSARKTAEKARAAYDAYIAMGWDVTINDDYSISIHSTVQHA